MRRLAAVAAVAILGASLTLAIADTTALYLWWAVAPGLAFTAVLVGLYRHRPSPATPWLTLLSALGLLWVGWTISAVLGAGIADGTVASVLPWLRDAIYAVAYPTVGVASLLMVRARTGGRDRDSAIDALIVMVALATALGAWIFVAGDPVSEVGLLDRIWVRASPLVLAAVTTASVRLLFAGGHRLVAGWLVFAASALALVGNLWTSQLLRDGQPTQEVGIDVLWVLAFVAIGAAALHPSMARLTESVSAEELVDGLPLDRLLIIGAALLVPPVAHLRGHENTGEVQLTALGSVLVVGLVMWRVSRLLVERDRARRAAADGAARDAAMAAIGADALEEHDLTRLLADARTRIEDALPRGEVTLHGPCPSPRAVDLEHSDGRDTVGDTRPYAVTHRLPIEDGSHTVAELHVYLPPDVTLTEGEQHFLEAVATLLSSAARRRTAEADLRHAALHDPLTGLANRTLMLERLAHHLANRDGQQTAVVFLDLDGFKQVNDALGHEGGDEVLRTVGARLVAAVRPQDTVARFAGDEFVVVLPAITEDDLGQVVERLAAACRFDVTRDGRRLLVTASVGAAVGRAGRDEAEALVHAADLDMYGGKPSDQDRRGSTASSSSGPRDRSILDAIATAPASTTAP